MSKMELILKSYNFSKIRKIPSKLMTLRPKSMPRGKFVNALSRLEARSSRPGKLIATTWHITRTSLTLNRYVIGGECNTWWMWTDPNLKTWHLQGHNMGSVILHPINSPKFSLFFSTSSLRFSLKLSRNL